jgi:hypothetical protein
MDIEKVEIKFTAAYEDEGRVLEFLAAHSPAHRTVYFYDTPDLALKDTCLFLRGRVTEGAGESTVKLRPVTEQDAAAAKDISDDVKVELDVVGTKRDPSAKLDQEPVDPAAIAAGDTDRLFSKDQRKLIERVAGDDAFNGLEVLGPITARVWEVEDLPGFPFKLAAEEWSIPGEHFIELSIKVKPGKADEAQAAFRAFLTGLVTNIEGDRSRKTERMLARLAGALTPG